MSKSNCGHQRDEMLEALSDKVRMGEPIGFLEAIAVIDYQNNLRLEREANSWRSRLRRWLGLTHPGGAK